MKDSHRMLHEAREREALDFSRAKRKSKPWDGDTDSEFGREMEIMNEVEDERYQRFFMPMIDSQLSSPGSSLTGRSIMEEITEMELDHKLPHFSVPIGRLPQRVRKARARTAAQLAKLHNERMDERQTQLRARQKHNDNVLNSLIARRF